MRHSVHLLQNELVDFFGKGNVFVHRNRPDGSITTR